MGFVIREKERTKEVGNEKENRRLPLQTNSLVQKVVGSRDYTLLFAAVHLDQKRAMSHRANFVVIWVVRSRGRDQCANLSVEHGLSFRWAEETELRRRGPNFVAFIRPAATEHEE